MNAKEILKLIMSEANYENQMDRFWEKLTFEELKKQFGDFHFENGVLIDGHDYISSEEDLKANESFILVQEETRCKVYFYLVED